MQKIAYREKLEYVAELICAQRQQKDWSRTVTAERAGYENLNKGRRRLDKLEDPDSRDTTSLARFLSALDIERRELEEWFDELEEAELQLRRRDSVLGTAFYDARRSQRLSIGDIAAQVHLQSDPARFIQSLENAEMRFPRLEHLYPVTEVLGFSCDEAESLLEREYAYFDEHHLENPTLYTEVTRPAAGSTERVSLAGMETREIIQEAERRAKQLELSSLRACAKLSPSRTVVVNHEGERFGSRIPPVNFAQNGATRVL